MTGDAPRARLLRAGQELPYRRDKIADLSLRGHAEQLGTSHCMLIHISVPETAFSPHC